MKELFVSWRHSAAGKKGAPRAKEILKSADGRLNIAPLYDVWAAPPSAGLPDFKRSTLRRVTHTGARMAPTAWRSSSMEITELDDGSGWIVFDNDFSIKWLIVSNEFFRMDDIETKLIDILNISLTNKEYKLPSYDQFISLVEGLYQIHDNLIVSGGLYLVADTPSEKEYLLVSIDNKLEGNRHLRVVDRERRISGTKRTVSAFVTGTSVSHNYSSSLRVRQVWIVD